jgi:hypothetical protein
VTEIHRRIDKVSNEQDMMQTNLETDRHLLQTLTQVDHQDIKQFLTKLSNNQKHLEEILATISALQQKFSHRSDFSKIKASLASMQQQIMTDRNEHKLKIADTKDTAIHQYHDLKSAIENLSLKSKTMTTTAIDKTTTISEELEHIMLSMKSLFNSHDTHQKQYERDENRFTQLKNHLHDLIIKIENSMNHLNVKSNETQRKLHDMEQLLSDDHIDHQRREHIDYLKQVRERLQFLQSSQNHHNEIIQQAQQHVQSNDFVTMKNQIEQLMTIIQDK